MQHPLTNVTPHMQSKHAPLQESWGFVFPCSYSQKDLQRLFGPLWYAHGYQVIYHEERIIEIGSLYHEPLPSAQLPLNIQSTSISGTIFSRATFSSGIYFHCEHSKVHSEKCYENILLSQDPRYASLHRRTRSALDQMLTNMKDYLHSKDCKPIPNTTTP